jgi:flavin reductase (DIM6/NTAB) family NADH-FMN oxidoreductase RutF
MQKHIDYSEAIKTKYPEQVVIVIAKDEHGKPNPITLGWAMPVSFEPPMWAVAIAEEHYTAEIIRFAKCFTLCFPTADQKDVALFYGSRSGRDIDKLRVFPSKIEPAKKINSVLLSDAVANFECRLESEHKAGDHTIFVGRIEASYINTEPNTRLYSLGPGHKMGGLLSAASL